MIVMDYQSGYSYHQQDKQIVAGCLGNREGQATVQFKKKVRLFRRFGGGWYILKKCSVFCCRVIDASTTSSDV